jgi:Mg2+/Co2+ transporter CorB
VSIVETAPGVYRVTGMTSLRRLARRFRVALPGCESVTVAGIVQEVLERLPKEGDVCRWGPFRFTVLEVPAQGVLLAEMTLVEPGKEDA